ncbi:hypothetical protein LXD69_07190 [Flavobacterium sediminilitoris]|uniref:VapC45 PIN like domain-containing protein n=1 Tax=Flavobacterium sediminilitoris TaxID=2024526 RepID=A0ABY4HR04_9FLAO|nr:MULTISPECIES: hypothetical protein [Flavobacterium]UOX35295.1 hypothetical protein LXD69_07190 [Flavobacterium sediminilitoris]
MSWNPKFFIIYPRKIIAEIEKCSTEYLCAGNLSDKLKEVLNVKSIGSELKIIWNNNHKWQLIKDYDLEIIDLEDYVKSDCSILTFKTEFLMKKSVKALRKLGVKSEMICTDNYRDVIIQQAFYKRNGVFFHSNEAER